MSVTTGTFPGVRIVDMPDLGVITDTSSLVGEHAGSGRFGAPALVSYIASKQPPVWWANVRDAPYSAKGDGVTDDTAALQAAINSGLSVYLPAGTYLVKNALICPLVGQLIQGAGRALTTVVANSTFNMSAQGVFVFTSGEPAAYLKGFKIRFVQPDTAVRGSLITYPPGVNATNQPRFILEEMAIVNATVAVSMGQNAGGAYIRDLQASFYQYGVYIDGSVDTVRIDDLHCAGFEMTASQLSIAQSLGTTCIASGRCDDLKLSGCLFLFYADISLFAGASGYTFGSAVNCGFDGFNGIDQTSGGRFQVIGSYFTATQAGFHAINLTSGALYIDSCWFGQENAGSGGFVRVNAATGSIARLLMNNCSFEHNAADVSSVVVTVAGTGVAETMISNTYFTRYANLAYTQPTVVVGTGAGAYLTMTGCRTPQIGTGSGTFVSIGADNLHRITGNVAYGWTFAPPVATLAAYAGNKGGVGNYLTATGGGPVTTVTAANAATLTLPPGDWDVHGVVKFTASGGAAPTALLAGLSTTTGAFSGAPDAGGQQSISAAFTANTANSLTTSTTRLNLTIATTVYLVAQANFPSGSVSAAGFIGARQAT